MLFSAWFGVSRFLTDSGYSHHITPVTGDKFCEQSAELFVIRRKWRAIRKMGPIQRGKCLAWRGGVETVPTPKWSNAHRNRTKLGRTAAIVSPCEREFVHNQPLECR
jgi:hypothetical protein